MDSAREDLNGDSPISRAPQLPEARRVGMKRDVAIRELSSINARASTERVSSALDGRRPVDFAIGSDAESGRGGCDGRDA